MCVSLWVCVRLCIHLRFRQWEKVREAWRELKMQGEYLCDCVCSYILTLGGCERMCVCLCVCTCVCVSEFVCACACKRVGGCHQYSTWVHLCIRLQCRTADNASHTRISSRFSSRHVSAWWQLTVLLLNRFTVKWQPRSLLQHQTIAKRVIFFFPFNIDTP